jgi:hypothetical protein
MRATCWLVPLTVCFALALRLRFVRTGPLAENLGDPVEITALRLRERRTFVERESGNAKPGEGNRDGSEAAIARARREWRNARRLDVAIETRVEIREAFVVRAVAGFTDVKQDDDEAGSCRVAANAGRRLNVDRLAEY